eukprot:485310_1
MAALHPKSSKWIVLAVIVGLFVVGGIVLIVKNQSNDTTTGQEKLEQQLNIKAAFDHSFKAVQNPLTSTNNEPNVDAGVQIPGIAGPIGDSLQGIVRDNATDLVSNVDSDAYEPITNANNGVQSPPYVAPLTSSTNNVPNAASDLASTADSDAPVTITNASDATVDRQSNVDFGASSAMANANGVTSNPQTANGVSADNEDTEEIVAPPKKAPITSPINIEANADSDLKSSNASVPSKSLSNSQPNVQTVQNPLTSTNNG